MAGETKFTPGPWHLCQHLKSAEDDLACTCGYRGVIYGPDHDIAYAICQPGHDRPWREEEWGSEPARYPREVELANARLIAAAPDMLEALWQYESDLLHPPTGDSIERRLQRVRTILAKIGGAS